MDGPAGVMHDGGVLWHETNVQFQARSESPEAVEEVADSIRDVLIQYAGTSVFKAGEEIAAYRPHHVTLLLPARRTRTRHFGGGFRGVAQTRVRLALAGVGPNPEAGP